MSTDYIETYIMIHPNSGAVGSGDDWSSTSPFTGSTCTTAFVISNIRGVSLGAGYTTLANRLLRIGKIDRSVKVFSAQSTEQGFKINGVGGVVKVGDFSFNIQNLNDDVDAFGLLGRKLTVQILIGATQPYLFTGKIYKVKPANKEINFIARGNSQLWNKEIGTITSFKQTEYRSRIYPISFGDLTDSDALMPIAVDKDPVQAPTLFLSEHKQNAVDSFYVWDDEQKVAHNAFASDDVVLDSDNKQVTLNTAITNLQGAFIGSSGDVRTMFFDDTTKVGTELSGSPTLVAGDIYVSGSGVFMEYIEKVGDTYSFYAKEAPPVGTYSKVTGDVSSPSHITSTLVSPIVYPVWWPDKTEELVNDVMIVSGTTGAPLDAKPKAVVVRIDNEEFLILNAVAELTGAGARTSLKVVAGYNNTTKASHSDNADVYFANQHHNYNKWLVRAVFPLKEISNFYTASDSSAGEANVLEFENVYNLLNNFQYLPEEDVDRFKISFNDSDYNYFLMDLDFGRIDLKGHIKEYYLLGSFEADHLDALGESLIYILSGQVDDLKNKRIGINMYSAKQIGVAVEGQPITEYASTSAVQAAVLSSIVYNSAVASVGSTYATWSNNIEGATQGLLDYPLSGGWYYDGGDGAYTLFTPTDGKATRPADISDLENKRLALLFYYYKKATFYLNNLALLVEAYIDPIKYQVWAKGKGQIYDGTYNANYGELTYDTEVGVTDLVWTVEDDGTYIYVAANDLGIRAYNAGLTSILDTQDDGGNYRDIYADTSAQYVAALSSGLHKYTFNGSSFTHGGTYTPSSNGASGNSVIRVHGHPTNNRIYMCNNYSGEPRLYVVDSSLTYEQNQSFTGSIRNVFVTYKGTNEDWVHVVGNGSVYVYVYNTSTNTFTLQDTQVVGGAEDVWVDGQLVFVACGAYGLYVYYRDNTTGDLSLLSTSDSSDAYRLHGDSTNRYVALTNANGAIDLFYYAKTGATLDFIVKIDSYRRYLGAPLNRYYHYQDCHYFNNYWYGGVSELGLDMGVERLSLETGNVLIENPVSVIEHLAYKELGLTYNNVDSATFGASTLGRQNYKTAFALYEKTVKFRTLAEDICREHGLILSEAYNGKLAMYTVERNSALRTITNAEILLNDGGLANIKDSFTTVDNLMTSLVMNYKKRFTDGVYADTYNADSLIASDLSNAKDVIDIDHKATIDFDTIRDENTVKAVAYLLGDYYSTPLREITIQCALSTYDVQVGSWISFENTTYVKGSANKEYLVIGQRIQLGFKETKPYIEFKVLEKTVSSGSLVYGTGAFTLPEMTMSGSGNVANIGGSGAFSLPELTMSGTGSVT